MARHTEITFEEGWSFLQKGIAKLIRIIEGEPEPAFDAKQYMEFYTTVYHMCNQKPGYLLQLYEKYREVIEHYTIQSVLPSFREKHDEYMLRELVKRWNNHKVLVKWLTRYFLYLDRYVALRGLPSLKKVGLTYFHDLVYCKMHYTAKDVVIALIHKEREGEQIDRELVKSVIDVYVEIGMGNMKRYKEDFESFMLQDTALYYSSKASKWIEEDSCPDYMLKSEECLKRERERVTHYLHSSTKPKLVEKVQNELLAVVAKQLLENENSGCCALLRDNKIDDLSRMYRLYHPIPQGLGHVADLFKQHIITGGNATKQLLTELQDKYMLYVTECFQNNTIFHKALKEAFEILSNKTEAGISSAELLGRDHVVKEEKNSQA